MFNFLVAELRFPAIFLCLVFLLLAGCRSTNQTEATNSENLPETTGTADFSVPSPNINLANPLVVSKKPEDVALCAKINETIEKSVYSNARWGVFVVSLKDGRVVCERDGRKLFNPASIQKTLTAIVGLDKLGADFRWKTGIYAENQIDADGNLNGDLVLYGQGAPDFDSAALENLIAQLQAKGLKSVKGNIIGDSSYFRGDTIGDGWTWNELQWYYGAEASALTFNENQAFINVENGEGRATTDYVKVRVGQPKPINKSSTSEANYEASGIKRGLEDNNFYVWGNSKNFGVRVAVHNPAELAAKNLKEGLVKKGIAVDGEIQSRDWKSEKILDAAKAQKLAEVESQTLAEIVKKMNKHSVNLHAELILRTIGKNFGDTLNGEIQRPQNVRGDDIAGAALIKKWLAEHHIATEDINIADGSGLSRLDFVTPEAFAKAFIYGAQSQYDQVFTDSLPISATDGTLGGRLAKVKGKVLAKTGTISYVNSLAGYADTQSGEVFTFSVMTNNDTRKNGTVSVIDLITTLIVNGKLDDAKDAKTANSNPQNTNSDNTNQPNFVIEKQSKK